MRLPLIALMLLMPFLAGCATKDAATQAAEQVKMESADDAACQKQGAPATPAYEACRKNLAEARAEQGAIQEQKRRDFDRTLGAGTEGQNGY